MHPEAVRALRAYLKERADGSPWLFVDNRGHQMQVRALDQMFRRAATRAGLAEDKRHFHALRHSCATNALSDGADIRHIQAWLGHRDVNTTAIYAAIVNPVRDRKARELFSKRSYTR